MSSPDRMSTIRPASALSREQEAQTQGAEADDHQLFAAFGRVHVPLQTVDLLHIGEAQRRAEEKDEG